jgi:hypothetical protein
MCTKKEENKDKRFAQEMDLYLEKVHREEKQQL